jgi:hypothetical protein
MRQSKFLTLQPAPVIYSLGITSLFIINRCGGKFFVQERSFFVKSNSLTTSPLLQRNQMLGVRLEAALELLAKQLARGGQLGPQVPLLAASQPIDTFGYTDRKEDLTQLREFACRSAGSAELAKTAAYAAPTCLPSSASAAACAKCKSQTNLSCFECSNRAKHIHY